MNRSVQRTRFVLAGTAALFSGACSAAVNPAASPLPAGPVAEELTLDASAPILEGVDFVVYHADGSEATLEELVRGLGAYDAVLMGEQHNDPITHRVQYQIFNRANQWWGGTGPMIQPTADGRRPPNSGAGGREVVLSLEMFERDVQYVLDEYLNDLISETHFRASSRPWGNYQEDYRPLVELAKSEGIAVVAANAPRRYVNRVSRLGPSALDDLTVEATQYLPPLPYPGASVAYKAEWDALMGDAAMHMQGDPLDGQTLWDASMGHAISTAIDQHDNALVVHLAGGFHVENHTGTPESIQHYRPGTKSLVVAIRPTDDPSVFGADHSGLGDFVVLTKATPGS